MEYSEVIEVIDNIVRKYHSINNNLRKIGIHKSTINGLNSEIDSLKVNLSEDADRAAEIVSELIGKKKKNDPISSQERKLLEKLKYIQTSETRQK